MQMSGTPYFGFIILLLTIYKFIPVKFRNILLLSASYFFYALWEPRFLVLIFATGCVDFLAIRKIESSQTSGRKRFILVLSLLMNFSVLFFFKTKGLFSNSIMLPLGVSFYTFQSTAFVIEGYRGHLPKKIGFVEFLLSISFFPQVLSGPLSKPLNLLSQIQDPLRPLLPDFYKSLWLINLGLFKKLFIADNLATYLQWAKVPGNLTSGMDAWLAGLANTIRYYCDFSGYSDIAIGSALLFGIILPINFNLPLFATNIRDLWSRWHITLGLWFQNYLFKPLARKQSNYHLGWPTLITMALIGVWHGVTLNYFFWGLAWGIMLIVSRLKVFKIIPNKIARFSVFPIWIFIGSFFAFDSLKNSFDYAILLLNPFSYSLNSVPDLINILFFTLPLFFYERLLYKKNKDANSFTELTMAQSVIFFFVFLFLTLVGGQFNAKEFLYFQF